MSIESLREDLKANMTALAAMEPALAQPADVVKHLRETLWPFFEAVVDELAEVDDCVQDIVEKEYDLLQPETAATFSAIIAGGLTCAAALRLRLDMTQDAQLLKVVAELERNLAAGTEILKDIVVDNFDDDDDEEEDDEDDDDDGDDEDDDDGDDEGDR